MCCLVTLDELFLNYKNIRNFFKTFKPLKGRGIIQKVKKFGKTFYLVDESYNANPLSVKSAVENFSKIRTNGKKKYFFFGDMMELGNKSQIYHKKAIKLINNTNINKIFVFGKRTSEVYKFIKKDKRGEIITSIKKFYNRISKILKNGDYLMIKGSNSTKLHKVSEILLKGKKYAL
jgi:UDP-N-acetylmuramyl pentapeptide synthase